MRLLLRLCLALGLLCATRLAGQSNGRFSQSLNGDERIAAGLARLTSDDVAVIDALVRRDTGKISGSAEEASAPTFTGRLTPGERSTAGLAKLTAAEQSRLDALVSRFQGGALARTLLAPPTYLARSSPLRAAETKREREIHGSFTLSYGVGSHGYSEKSGSMVLNFDDPAHNLAVSVGYTETHVKGGRLYQDGVYDPLRYDLLRPDPFRTPADPAERR